VSNGDRGGIGNIFGDYSVPKLDQINADTYFPTGFPYSDDTECTLGFTDGTRTFSITPVGTYFDFWYAGKRWRKLAAETKVITDVDGVHWIYYDENGALQISLTTPSFALPLVARILWDATNNKSILYNERHKFMLAEQHYRDHFSLGALWQSGFGISGYTLDSDADADVTFGLDAGIFTDEDIVTEVAAAADPAQMLVLYRGGVGGPIRWDTATDFAFKNTAAGRVNYNSEAAGTWSQTQCTDKYYVNYYICATMGVSAPYMSFQGQAEYKTLAEAKLEGWGDLDKGELGPEIRPLYKLTIRSKNTFAGARKAKISYVEDIRGVGVPNGAEVSPGAHPRLHTLDNVLDHGPISSWAENGILTFNANGLPQLADTAMIYHNSAVAVAGPTLDTRRSRGTLAAPTGVQSGDVLRTDYTRGYNGTSYAYSLYSLDETTEIWGAGALGMKRTFYKAKTGAAVRTEFLQFQGDNKVLFSENAILANGVDLACATAFRSDVFSAATPGGDAHLKHISQYRDGTIWNAWIRYNGTWAAKTQLNNADVISYQQFYGYHGAAGWNLAAALQVDARENYVGAGNAGSRMTFQVADVGDGAPTTYLQLDGNGETIDLLKAVDARANITLANGVDLACATAGNSDLFSSGTPGGSAYVNFFTSDIEDTNVTAGATVRSYLADQDYQVKDDITHNLHGLQVSMGKTVAATKTDSGRIAGARLTVLRNNISGADDDGTLAEICGMQIYYGHNNEEAGETPQTTAAYGIYISPYKQTGTIGTAYDIYLAAEVAGGAVTNPWGIYQANTKANRLSGDLQMGADVIMDNGKALNCLANGGIFYPKYTEQAGLPAPAVGELQMTRDSGAGEVRLVFNDPTDGIVSTLFT